MVNQARRGKLHLYEEIDEFPLGEIYEKWTQDFEINQDNQIFDFAEESSQ